MGFSVVLLLAAPVAVLSFDDVLRGAEAAPAVEGSRLALQTKRQLDRQISSLTQNPSLSVQVGYRALPRTAREPEVLFELVQPWNVAGHGHARRQAASLEEDLLGAELRERRLVQRLRAARAWVELWTAERLWEAIERELKIALELEGLVAKAVAAQAATRAELAEAQTFTAEIEQALLAAEGERYERGLDLAQQIASASTGALGTTGGLPTPPLPDLSSEAAQRLLLERAAALPEVARRRLEERVERARAVEERAARGTQLGVGVVLQRDAPGGLVASGMIRVTPSLFEHGQRERATLLAEAERAAQQVRASSIEARVELERTLHEVEHTAAVATGLEGKLVPSSRASAEAKRRIFRAGESTLFEVLTAERIAVAAAGRLERARAQAAWAKVKLWLLLLAMEGRS